MLTKLRHQSWVGSLPPLPTIDSTSMSPLAAVSVLQREPDFDGLPPMVPARMRRGEMLALRFGDIDWIQPTRADWARSYRKCRCANATPDPDFKYRSKATARLSSPNSMTTSMDHGRYLAVWIQLPALCSMRRVATSAVRPV
jgi:hypothetical protein